MCQNNVVNQKNYLLTSFAFLVLIFKPFQFVYNYLHSMPKKLSRDIKNNVTSLKKAGKTTKDIVKATKVLRSQVIRMEEP